MYGIVRGIPKPPTLKQKQAGSKYPLADMEVGDSFVVPYTDMQEGETPEQFRNRVYKSCRNYALRDYNERKGEAANTQEEVTKKDFSAALMTENDKSEEKKWASGDVVVWRDA